MCRAAIIAEAIRLNRRYQTEIVEALTLCPWAQRSRIDGKVCERVLLSAQPAPEEALRTIEALGSCPEVTIGLVIFPCLRLGRIEFGRFVSGLAHAHGRAAPEREAPFAMAAFHPDATADLSAPDRLVPFIRRTPDPTIQLVRRSALDEVRNGQNEGTHFVDIQALATLGLSAEDTLSLRDRITRSNHRTITRLGVRTVEATLQDIFRDRDAAYARLGIGRE